MQDNPIPPGFCQCGCGEKTNVVKKSVARKGLVRGEPYKFVHGHGRRLPGPDYKVNAESGCWDWLRTKSAAGYGRLCRDGKGHLAHRWYYQQLVGPIPEGLTLDHLCRNRACVNPDHLEPVTSVENVMRGESVPARKARQTHCKRGHELSGDNVYLGKKGHRDCRACHRIDQRAFKAKQREAAA